MLTADLATVISSTEFRNNYCQLKSPFLASGPPSRLEALH